LFLCHKIPKSDCQLIKKFHPFNKALQSLLILLLMQNIHSDQTLSVWQCCLSTNHPSHEETSPQKPKVKQVHSHSQSKREHESYIPYLFPNLHQTELVATSLYDKLNIKCNIMSMQTVIICLNISFRLELIGQRGGVSHSDPSSPFLSISSMLFL